MRTLLMNTCALFLLCATPLWADPPELKDCGLIKDGAKNLLVEKDSIPTCVDWNNDGRKDLLVGQFVKGKITLFLNKGTNLNPVFDGGAFVESNGAPIQVPPY